MANLALVNGLMTESISIRDRGLAYGDGLFETIKVSRGHAEFLSLHIDRLLKSSASMQLGVDGLLLQKEVAQVLAGMGDKSGVLKIMITRGYSGRGYRSAPNIEGNRIVLFESGLPDYANNEKHGVHTMLCDQRLSWNAKSAGHKHLSRLENVQARSEWSCDHIAEGLMMDQSHKLIEGTMSNIYLVRNNIIQTPSLKRCGVDGIIRRVVVTQIAPALNLQVAISDFSVSDIYQADEMFLSNSVIGIWPVIAVGCHHKSIGPITRSLQHGLANELKLDCATSKMVDGPNERKCA